MFVKWLFDYFPERKKADVVKNQGLVLGSRIRDGRKIYLYMIEGFFAEVTYSHDNIDEQPEIIETFSDLAHLNPYLEQGLEGVY
jgi:hypothetical protein